MRKSEDLHHKHVYEGSSAKWLVYGDSVTETHDEVPSGKVNALGGSFEDYNVVIRKFISQTIHHGHERFHHHETSRNLILDASLTHVCFMNSIFFSGETILR